MGSNPCRILSLLGIAHPVTRPPFQVQEIYKETSLRRGRDCIWNVMVDCIWNTRVRKHNLRGSENKMNMIVWELMGISVWHYTPLRKKKDERYCS